MPVPGYDPEDLDDVLESNLDPGEIEARLSDEELAAYREGEANLVDLLDEAQIQGLVGGDGE
jgi:hypothetical protein